MQAWGERYRANPRDPEAAVNYAQALRGIGQRAQAVAVLEQASIHNAGNMELAGAYGRALADVGKHEQALQVLNRAHTPDRPDWRILNVQGVGARPARPAPGGAKPLRHRAADHAGGAGGAVQSRTVLRAVEEFAGGGGDAQARVRRPQHRSARAANLALVVGLQGRFAEAEAIARADLPPDQAAANVAYLRQMLAQQNALQARAQPKRGRPRGPAS